MAKQKNNIIMHRTRGMVGKQIVFKRRAGVSYVSAPPETNPNRLPTADQISVRDRFRQSVQYAKNAILDPTVKEMYLGVAKRNQSAYNVAFSDAYNAPEISHVATHGYLGQPGNLIVIEAHDDFKVAMVEVLILDENGDEVERGFALPNSSGTVWTYAATQQVSSISGYTVIASAFDVPGNRTELQVSL